MLETRCELTELPVDQCAHCTADKAHIVAAQYPGTCPTCGQEIEKGQHIRDRGDGEWEHSYHR